LIIRINLGLNTCHSTAFPGNTSTDITIDATDTSHVTLASDEDVKKKYPGLKKKMMRQVTYHSIDPGPRQFQFDPAPVPSFVLGVQQNNGEKKRRSRSNAARVRPCEVCGESAGKHSYYGGEVCPSCRAFFRRSVQAGYSGSYKCDNAGGCKVTMTTRRKCQYCRYQLCLAAGMKTAWVLTEQERRQKFEAKSRTHKKQKEEVEKTSDMVLSEEDIMEINDLVKASGHFERSKVNDMETSLLRNIVKMIAFYHPLPASGQRQMREVLTKRFKKIAKRIPEFTFLCYKDREEIVKRNIPILVELHICSLFKPGKAWQDQFTPLMGEEEVHKLYNKLTSLSVTGISALCVTPSLVYPTITQAQLPVFTRRVQQIGGWAEDGVEAVLLDLVLLFSPNMLDLLERRRVEEIQTKFAFLLQKYLITKHPHKQDIYLSRFASGLNILSKCKEFQQELFLN